MAFKSFLIGHPEQYMGGTTAWARYYSADTFADLPSSGLVVGSIAFTADTGKLYRATDTTTWTEVGGAGGANIKVSAGTLSQERSDVTFANSNGISFGLNTNGVITGTVKTDYLITAALSDHSHGNPTLALTNLTGTTASNSAGLTLSLSAAAGGPGGGVTFSQFNPFEWQNVTNSTLGQSTVYFVPFMVPDNLYASRVNFFLSHTHTLSGTPNNQTAWLALGYALYTRGTGASSDRLSRSTSYSASHLSGSVSSSTRLSLTHYIGLSNATSHSTSQYGVQNASVTSYMANTIAGFRVLPLPMNVTMTPGQYWMAVSVRSASQVGSFVMAQNVLQAQFSNNIAYRVYGSNSAASNASFFPASNGIGIYSAQTAAFPDTIPLTSNSIRAAPIVTLPYFNISGIGTGTGIL